MSSRSGRSRLALKANPRPPPASARGCAACALGRPHELTADLERMLVDRAPWLSANWARLYDETLSRWTRVRCGGEKLTLAEDPEPQDVGSRTSPRRKAAAQGLAEALEEKTPVLGALPQHHRAGKQVEATRWRKSSPSRSPPATSPTKSTPDAVAALEAAVVEAYPRHLTPLLSAES